MRYFAVWNAEKGTLVARVKAEDEQEACYIAAVVEDCLDQQRNLAAAYLGWGLTPDDRKEGESVRAEYLTIIEDQKKENENEEG